MNGAIADVGSLYDCLEAIHQGKAKDDILDVYCQVRREKFKTMIDPQSQGMMKTIFSNPEAVVPNHPMYKFSQLMEKDPELAKKNMPVRHAYLYTLTIGKMLILIRTLLHFDMTFRLTCLRNVPHSDVV